MTYGWITAGTTRCSASETIRAISSEPCASSTKSSSDRRCVSSSSASAASCSSRAFSERPSAKDVSERSSSRSSSTSCSIRGRRILTTTSRPVRSRPPWICAIEAHASGCSSSRAKISSPISSSTIRRSLFERERRHVVDELLELLDVDVRQQVRPRRQHLPELDEGGAELLQPFAKRSRALTRRRLVADRPDLGQHAQQPAASRDAANLERAPGAASSPAHRGRSAPPENAGNAGYSSRSTAAFSSSTETVPSKRSLIVPSAPTTNTHGSEGSFHSRTQVFSPFVGSLSL